MTTYRATLRKRLWHQLLGLIFLLVAALFFTLCVAVYNKAFDSYVGVRLQTDTVGNQMHEGADVKIKGVLVGEVRSVTTGSRTAELKLALDPEKAHLVPANVSARLLPKTLFGERYVALQLPADPAQPIEAGAVIGQDRSESAIELQQVLDNVLPLLQAVQPQKLASTLNAVSNALDGRGEQLGETLVRVSEYLGELNPSLPDLKADITALADVSDVYNRAAPDFLKALSDLTTTSRTIVEKQRELYDLYARLTTASIDLGRFLEVNKENLIDLGNTTLPTVELLAKYAPQYPCMLKQFADGLESAEKAFGHGTDEMNHVYIRFAATRGKYLPGVDEPEYLDKRGPRCYEQKPPPEAFPQYPPGGPIKDGSTKPAPPRKTGMEDPVGDLLGGVTGSSGGGSTAGAPRVANTPGEHQLLAALLAPTTGIEPADQPGWATFMVAPLYRGTAVTVR